MTPRNKHPTHVPFLTKHLHQLFIHYAGKSCLGHGSLSKSCLVDRITIHLSTRRWKSQITLPSRLSIAPLYTAGHSHRPVMAMICFVERSREHIWDLWLLSNSPLRPRTICGSLRISCILSLCPHCKIEIDSSRKIILHVTRGQLWWSGSRNIILNYS